MIFVQEVFIDFDDYLNPLKERTKVINKISLSQEDYLTRYVRRSLQSKVRLNTANLVDSPWINPWGVEKDNNKVYLTVENTNVEQSKWPNDFFEAIFQLSADQTIKSRHVYNLIDMIADVSGLSDIILVFTATVTMTFYQERNKIKHILKHLDPVEIPVT